MCGLNLNRIYIECKSDDVSKIRSGIASKSIYELKCAARQLWVGASYAGDDKTLQACNEIFLITNKKCSPEQALKSIESILDRLE